ncbi:hypothetical protein B7486_72890, partial [cyanobacterium TDX16]
MAEAPVVASPARSDTTLAADGPVPDPTNVEPGPTGALRWGLLALAVWGAAWLVTLGVVLRIAREQGHEALRLGAAPLVGRTDLHLDLRLLLPLAVGGVLVVLPRIAEHLRWRSLLLLVVLFSIVWIVALNMTRTNGLTR